ncbi:DNA replication/repair protein RecF [Paeniglutamicibacter cryotolerans]|uniref:DNA replication and repair protein RecF n=1 Tax=Paeniglutamicibacter cryotolerans TaxID=670079 RepID=A0A839QGC2_9MICC|nr:DNA replication/repair protein RecF [Paeniglutamicibacter cryotolerans]MBB2994940.1 DNA replication and repair protein RecF [Paeniglutamicibacter cryotolerans]
MYISHVSLTDFRSYDQLDLELAPGTNVLVGANGVGKTNIAEAIGYLATLSSHRVPNDGPLLRFGTERAMVRARVHRGRQTTALEVEITAGKANRARINRANPVRSREILGIVKTVLFAPEDLALVKGDPSNRRRFLDDLLVSLRPAQGANRGDYDRVLKQRNALLKSARKAGKLSETHEATLEVWDHHLAQAGARLLRGRLEVLGLLAPYLGAAYASLTDGSKPASAFYRSTIVEDIEDDGSPVTATPGMIPGSIASPALLEAGLPELEEMFMAAIASHRKKEVERGMTLVGPHRDELVLSLGPAPAKGYASHGETWSLALALRLASYKVFGEDDPREGAGPILILDDVFAELDVSRRAKLAAIVAGADQVIVTAAVAADVPAELSGRVLNVGPGGVTP